MKKALTDTFALWSVFLYFALFQMENKNYILEIIIKDLNIAWSLCDYFTYKIIHYINKNKKCNMAEIPGYEKVRNTP